MYGEVDSEVVPALLSGEGEPPEPAFAHGMCRACYLEFLQVAGSCEDGAANPPAFTRGVQRELSAQHAEVRTCAMGAGQPMDEGQSQVKSLKSCLESDKTVVFSGLCLKCML